MYFFYELIVHLCYIREILEIGLVTWSDIAVNTVNLICVLLRVDRNVPLLALYST